MIGVQNLIDKIQGVFAVITFKRSYFHSLGHFLAEPSGQLHLAMHRIIVGDETAQKSNHDGRRFWRRRTRRSGAHQDYRAGREQSGTPENAEAHGTGCPACYCPELHLQEATPISTIENRRSPAK